MNEEERRKYEAFQYWIQTNTEKGVTTIPDNLCLFVVNLIKSLQIENEELKQRIREHTLLISPYYVEENYIPKQKVKDKIEEIKAKMGKDCIALHEFQREAKIDVLQELLEKEKIK